MSKTGKISTIFYADDDEDDQEVFREIISDLSLHTAVFTQSNGVELLEKLESATLKPDIIFLDLNMPKKNGFDALKEIRKNEKNSIIPIIIFSTSNNSETINYTKELGADLYISKPGSYTELKDTLFNVLKIDWSAFKPAGNYFLYSKNQFPS